MLTKIPKGMKDVLPAESARWRAVEKECRQAALLAGYREIRTPVLEHTELFARSAGESSDVVRKEMYTFKDKGDRSVTLKPESTAGTVRAFLESGLYAQALPMKMYYINAPHFRYEAPQSGRLREHHQFGMECFGASQPSADAELIVLVVELLDEIDQQAERLERCLTLAFSDAEARLKQAETRLKAREPEQLLSRYGLRLENVRQRLDNAASQRLQQTEARLRHAETRLRSSGPQETLRRGYAVALKDGRLLKSTADAAAGDAVRLMLQDGSLLTRVETVETER